MKAKASLLTRLILGIGLTLTGCASTEVFHDEGLSKHKPFDSLDEQTSALESPETRIARLENKILSLQEQIATFNKKEYFDPHEFRLSAWEILKGDYQKQMHELRNQIFYLQNTLSQSRGVGKICGAVPIKKS